MLECHLYYKLNINSKQHYAKPKRAMNTPTQNYNPAI